jgi:hypothetical protein
MAGKQTIEYPPNDVLTEKVQDVGVVKTAGEFGISPSTLRNYLLRNGLPTSMAERRPEPVSERAVSFTVESDDLASSPWTPEALLRSHGLEVDKWQVVRVRANRYGREDDPNVQLRIDAEPIEAPIEIPNPEDYEPIPVRKRPKKDPGDPKTVLIVSDHHAPHHSRPFHRCLVEWLRDEFEAGRIDRIEVNGDLLDASGPAGGGLTRHEVIPGSGYDSSLNEGLDAAYRILRDYRDACPEPPDENGEGGVRIVLKRGNHDERIEKALLSNGVAALYRVRPANRNGEEEVPALSLRRLLHCDLLGVEYIDENWERAESRINHRLTTVHGYTTSKAAGKTMLDSLSGSSLQGHTHRLSLLYRTTRHPDGPEVRVAGEVGCAAEISDGLGYGNPSKDWQNAAMVAKVWPDGDFALAPLIFLPNPDRLLTPDGRRYFDRGER